MPVSERALYQRVNRKLRAQDEVLKRARTVSDSLNVGDYFLVDLATNAVVGYDIDLEPYARELGALAKWEYLERAL